MSLPPERSTTEQVVYTWVVRSRSESPSFTASAASSSLPGPPPASALQYVTAK